MFCIEASRLARNGRDWHHLVGLCALVGTLLIDHDGVYDPRLVNDRLLLGLKGTMSEYVLSLFRQQGQHEVLLWYAKRYSTRLLEQLAQCVYTACEESGFRGFAEQQKREDAFVSRTVSAAWQAFQHDAGEFPTFEFSAIERLKNQIVPA